MGCQTKTQRSAGARTASVPVVLRACVSALAVLSALGAVSPAGADTTPDRVKAAAEEFDAGRRAFTARDYSSAADHFENAEHDVPSPEAIRLAIRARKMARQDARMATLAAAAMSRYADSKETVALAKQMIGQVRANLHKVDVSCEPACTLVLDGRVTPWQETTKATIFVDPGDHSLSAGWSGERNESAPLTAKAAGSSELSFKAPPLPPPKPVETQAPKPPPPPPKKGLPPLVFYLAAGATAVLGGVTIWSATDMVANPGKDKVRTDCAGRDESCPTYQDALSAQRRTNTLIGVTSGLAVGTAVVGLFFTKWGGSSPQEEKGSVRSFTPTVSVGQGVQVGASGTF